MRLVQQLAIECLWRLSTVRIWQLERFNGPVSLNMHIHFAYTSFIKNYFVRILGNNSFTGPIPASWSTLTNLVKL